jgi:hypothetical protein
MEWTAWNWINLFFVFLNGYFAIDCFKNGNNFMGHFNMFAVVINGIIVLNRI